MCPSVREFVCLKHVANARNKLLEAAKRIAVQTMSVQKYLQRAITIRDKICCQRTKKSTQRFLM